MHVYSLSAMYISIGISKINYDFILEVLCIHLEKIWKGHCLYPKTRVFAWLHFLIYSTQLTFIFGYKQFDVLFLNILIEFQFPVVERLAYCPRIQNHQSCMATNLITQGMKINFLLVGIELFRESPLEIRLLVRVVSMSWFIFSHTPISQQVNHPHPIDGQLDISFCMVWMEGLIFFKTGENQIQWCDVAKRKGTTNSGNLGETISILGFVKIYAQSNRIFTRHCSLSRKRKQNNTIHRRICHISAQFTGTFSWWKQNINNKGIEVHLKSNKFSQIFQN